MSENELLKPYDFDKLQWQYIGDGRKRLLSGGELAQDTFDRFNKGDQTLFFGVYVDTAAPIAEDRLIDAARESWIRLRYSIPTIAARIEYDEMDRPSLVYRPERSDEDLQKWAQRTLVVHTQESVDLDAIRNEVEGRKIPSEDGDQTWLHLVPGARSFGVLFHSHHAPFDGSALKIIFDKYLAQLAGALSDTPAHDPLAWGNEIENLLPAVFNVLAPSEPLPLGVHEKTPSYAHPYYAAIGTLLSGIGESLQSPYTFKTRPVLEKWPVVRRAYTRFSLEESTKILNSLRHSSGGRYTLTQLAHAALAMTLISDNPPTSESAAAQKIYNLSLADCRSSLREPYNALDMYPGYALGVYSMHIPVTLFLGDDGNPLPLDKDTLSRTMTALRAAYDAQKRFPAAISFMAQSTEIFTAQIKQAVAADQLPPNHGFAFSSDGLGEKYLRGTYSDVAGAPLLSISRFFTAVNRTDPGPFFRIWSWRGILELSVDFNSNSISAGEVQKHINSWKTIMLLVQEFNEENY